MFDLTPKSVSLASRVQTTASAYSFCDLPLNGRCRREGIKTHSYCVEKEFSESAQDYMSRANLSVKVLDFVQLGGTGHTELRTFRWEVSL